MEHKLGLAQTCITLFSPEEYLRFTSKINKLSHFVGRGKRFFGKSLKLSSRFEAVSLMCSKICYTFTQ